MKKIYGLSLLISLIFVLTSCSKVPQADIDAANAAIDSAKTAGTDQYLPDEFMAAQDSLKAALEMIEIAKSKFPRKYGKAEEMLKSVKVMADQSIANTEVKKNQVKEEVQTALTQVEALITEDKDLLTKAPKGKEGKAALDEIQAELSAVEAAVAEGKTMLDSGNYIGAKEKVTAATEKATAINNELKEAIAKVKGRK